MKPLLFVRSILLMIVLGSLAIWGTREYRRSLEVAKTSHTTEESASLPAIQGKQVVMTYFRSGVRCTSCKKIETFAAEAARNDLASELAKGRLTFQVIDLDDPTNNHFIKDYQLTSKSVILSYRIDGKEQRWENMDKIWDLLDEPAAFRSYLVGAVRHYLGS